MRKRLCTAESRAEWEKAVARYTPSGSPELARTGSRRGPASVNVPYIVVGPEESQSPEGKVESYKRVAITVADSLLRCMQASTRCTGEDLAVSCETDLR